MNISSIESPVNLFGVTSETNTKVNFAKIFDFFSTPMSKKILSVLVIILSALILLKVSFTKNINSQLNNSSVYFLNQCMWVWAILLIIIVVINLFGFIK